MLIRHSSIFQIISWNWKHLIKRTVQAKEVFWHVILISYLCKALCMFFVKIESPVFPKHILEFEALYQSIQTRKKLFCRMIVKNYLCNVLCYTMFPLYQLGFTLLWNSYRIGFLFPFKTNNSTRFLHRLAFTTQRFWKWHKIFHNAKV